MIRQIRNAVTAARHPTVAFDYLRWKAGEATGSPLLVRGAFNTTLQTSSFADYRSTRAFVPKPAEQAMIRRLSNAHPLFIDVGANFGVWTLALAAAHRLATVYAFEPTSTVFQTMRENVERNGLSNVRLQQLAVSSSNGTSTLRVANKMSIFNRLSLPAEGAESVSKVENRFTDAHVEEVQTVTLDDFCAQHNIDRIGFLKVDVEGAEPLVLRGAKGLLGRRAVESIWIEVDPENLAAMGESLDSMAGLMADAGYAFHFLKSDGSLSPAVDIRRERELNMVARPA